MERAGRVWGWTAPVERPQQGDGRKTTCRWTVPVARLQQSVKEAGTAGAARQRWQDTKGLQIQSRGEWHLEKGRAGGPDAMQTMEEGRNGQRNSCRGVCRDEGCRSSRGVREDASGTARRCQGGCKWCSQIFSVELQVAAAGMVRLQVEVRQQNFEGGCGWCSQE